MTETAFKQINTFNWHNLFRLPIYDFLQDNVGFP